MRRAVQVTDQLGRLTNQMPQRLGVGGSVTGASLRQLESKQLQLFGVSDDLGQQRLGGRVHRLRIVRPEPGENFLNGERVAERPVAQHPLVVDLAHLDAAQMRGRRHAPVFAP